MSPSSPDTGTPGGLRERKKAKTRAAIQHEALRLFCLQGYEATTVEQIAEAAEVSPSTLFRYFPAKEDLVLTDEYDLLIGEACLSQPPEIGPVEAVRRGLNAVLGHLSEEESADMRVRAELGLSVPDLRAAMLDQFSQAIRQLIQVVALRAGRTTDDFVISTLAGAIVGVMMSAELYWIEHPGSDLVQLLDAALAQLPSGLPF